MMCFPLRAKVTEYPHPDNNYFVDLVDPTQPGWVNPHANYKSIEPFKPKAGLPRSNIPLEQPALLFSSDFFGPYWEILQPKDLCSLSEANKSCYFAAKADLIWKIQMKKFLPNVTCLQARDCLFSPRQQFQIIFKTVHDRKKPFAAQLQHNFEKIEEFKSILAELEAFLIGLNLSKKHRTYTASEERNWLRRLVGNDYDGSIESIDPTSQQGRCLAAFRFIHQEFNDPQKFKDMLLSSGCGCALF